MQPQGSGGKLGRVWARALGPHIDAAGERDARRQTEVAHVPQVPAHHLPPSQPVAFGVAREARVPHPASITLLPALGPAALAHLLHQKSRVHYSSAGQRVQGPSCEDRLAGRYKTQGLCGSAPAAARTAPATPA